MGILTSQHFYITSFDSDVELKVNEDKSKRLKVWMNRLHVQVWLWVIVERTAGYTSLEVDMFKEQNREFTLTVANTLEINYCVTNLTGLFGCSRLIDRVKYSNGELVNPNRVKVLPDGGFCNTPSFMQGAVLAEGTYDTNYIYAGKNIVQGTKCVISVDDVPATEARMSTCCTMQGITEYKTGNIIPTLVPNFATFQELINWSDIDFMKYDCPSIFLNAYQSSHCDMWMKTYCTANPTRPECQVWLLKSTKGGRIVAADVYNSYCKSNLNSSVCTMFSLIANQYGMESFSDDALRSYCDNNPTDPNCQCYIMSNNTTLISASTYIGPLECWFKSCAEQPNQQFLLSSQIRQRKSCRITVCDINVAAINAPSAVVNIVNTCSGNIENSVVQNVSIASDRKMPLLVPFGTTVLLAGLICLVGRI